MEPADAGAHALGRIGRERFLHLGEQRLVDADGVFGHARFSFGAAVRSGGCAAPEAPQSAPASRRRSSVAAALRFASRTLITHRMRLASPRERAHSVVI
jgi:hypothetical protein